MIIASQSKLPLRRLRSGRKNKGKKKEHRSGSVIISVEENLGAAMWHRFLSYRFLISVFDM
jgi:hypothetical protein